jgi:hypothetical protein
MRYELLIVLVSDALSADALCMDQRDCEAIADFAAFCSNCKADVLVTYVPGGEDNIAAWVATSIHKYGDTGQDMSLLQDETMVRIIVYIRVLHIADFVIVGADSSLLWTECIRCANRARVLKSRRLVIGL